MAATLMSVTATNTSAPPTPRSHDSDPSDYTNCIHIINNIDTDNDTRAHINVGHQKQKTDGIQSHQQQQHMSDVDSTAALVHIFVIRKKRYRVTYAAGQLMWEQYQSKKGRISVPIINILAINPRHSDSTNDCDVVVNSTLADSTIACDDNKLTESTTTTTTQEQHQQQPQMPSLPIRKQFTVVYAKRSCHSANLNKWRYTSVTMHSTDAHVIDVWTRTMQNELNALTTRPKRLLLFVNPYGGKKRALQIYDSNVKPIFQIAGIDASVVISQRSNQIRDFIMTQSLEYFDGIVCIGGDGSFSEVFNGLIFRTIKDHGLEGAVDVLDRMPKIEMPIGVIPAGSTDTVAYCLNGTTDIQTNVLNIVLGQVNGLDLSSVSNQHELIKFYASVMSYGFLGDVAIESEKFRWMGPKRYDYSGFKKLLLNRGYEGEITMLMAPNDNTPAKGPLCLENCQMCRSHATHAPKTNRIDQSSVINKSESGKLSDSIECNDMHSTSSTKYSLFKKRTIVSASDNYTNNMLKTLSHHTDDAGHTTKTVNGKFFMVNGANISCACSRSPNGFSKFCHLCDGYIDLILVRHTTFFNNIKFLMAMSSQNCTISDLPHVEIYRTKKFSFRPNGLQAGVSAFNLHSSRVPISPSSDGSQHSSVWNCDGEVLHDPEVSIQSHRHLINVYRRGLFNPQIDEIGAPNPSNCCGLCIT